MDAVTITLVLFILLVAVVSLMVLLYSESDTEQLTDEEVKKIFEEERKNEKV